MVPHKYAIQKFAMADSLNIIPLGIPYSYYNL